MVSSASKSDGKNRKKCRRKQGKKSIDEKQRSELSEGEFQSVLRRFGR
jgi:hypothetical protein